MLLEPYVCDQRAFIPYFEQQYINLQKNVFFALRIRASGAYLQLFKDPALIRKMRYFHHITFDNGEACAKY